jgi:uncharacterized protein YoxC
MTTEADSKLSFFNGPILQVATLLVGLGVGWGMMQRTISEAKSETSKVQEEVHALVQENSTLNTRVALLENHRQFTDEKLSQIGQSLRDIDAVTRALHDNVLVLCQLSSKGDRCKP